MYSKILWDLSLDPELRREALAIDKWRRDQSAEKRYAREEGLEEGRQEGRSEERKKIALSMLEDGFDINVISKHSGLTKEEIENLK